MGTGIHGGGSGSGSSSSTSVPPAPASVAAKCGNNRITVSWAAAAAAGATPYSVYRATAPGAAGTLLGSPATTSWVDTTGTVGATYYYTVTAANSAGTSAASVQASETFYKVLAGAMQGKALTLSAAVTTFAGTSGLPVNGGVGASARFSLPQGTSPSAWRGRCAGWHC